MLIRVLLAVVAVGLAGCRPTGDGSAAGAVPSTTTNAPETTVTSSSSTTAPNWTTTTITNAPDPHAPPEWLGTRPLPLRPDGFGEVTPTPDELIDREFSTVDLLPPPVSDSFVSTIGPVPADVVARSTWSAECPVLLDDLAYVTISHWGFDGLPHTGELIVDAASAESIVEVFSRLHEHRFPIEQIRVIRADELDAAPTGDGNVTTAFVCRPVVGSTSWSMHAYGLAIDINPFHNPYVKGDLVLPELASYYADRSVARPGMILEGSVAVSAFDDIGWFWGGRWSTLDDSMHFSANNR